MTASVPERRINLNESEVTIAAPVRGRTWVDAARLHCWAAGRGSMDVPGHVPGVTISAGNSSTFTYRIWPRYQTTRYALGLVMTSDARTTADVEFPDGATAVTLPAESQNQPFPVTLYTDRASLSSSEAEIDFTITAPSGHDIRVDHVHIEAVPRVFLADDDSDLVAQRELFWPRQAITEANINDHVFARQALLLDACRRTGMVQHGWGSDSPHSAITSAVTTYTGVFTAGVGALGRALYSGETTRELSWRVLAYMSNGVGSADIRVTATSGDTATIAVPAGTTTATWLPSTGGSPSTFDVDCEDNTTTNGLRGGTWDDLTFEARTNGGADLLIETISVGEA